MKKYSILLIVFLTTISLSAQINQFDTNGKRHGKWKKKYDNGRTRYEGIFKHGKEIGVFKFYDIKTNKFPVILKKYSPNSTIANVTFYNVKNGKVLSKGKMDGKNKIGKWLYFQKDGTTTMIEENYVNGKLNGAYKSYYSNKKPLIIAKYKNGKLDGHYQKFSVKNKVYEDFNYKNGKLHGLCKFYDRLTGLITEEGNYENDERVGAWKLYIDGEYTHTIEVKKPKYPKKK